MPSPWTNRLLTSLLDEADQSARTVHHIDSDLTNNNLDNLELRMTTQEERDRAVIARIGGRAITLNRPDVTEADLLYVEHAGGSHTGDYYVTGCPTCDPPETVIERYQREGR